MKKRFDTTQVLLEQAEKAQAEGKPLERAFLEVILESAPPDLADAMLLGAKLDCIEEAGLQTLLGQHEDVSELLEQLAGYSFVRPNPDGPGYLYDSETRRLLLQIGAERHPGRFGAPDKLQDEEEVVPRSSRASSLIGKLKHSSDLIPLVSLLLLILYPTLIYWQMWTAILIVTIATVGGGILVWLISRKPSRKCIECQRSFPSNLKFCPFCGSLFSGRTSIQDFPTARLFAIDGPREGQEFLLRGGQVTIGGAPQSDIRLDDDLVSWEHAVLTFSDGEYVLYDRDSTNGTWVNGQRIAQATITPGQDQITIGPSIFVLQVAGQPQQIPSPLTEPVPAKAPLEKVYDFGEYERIATLGGGGAALVYKAVSKRDGETVAVKVFNRSDPYLREKFQKEGREIAQALHHPHIVRVYGGGNTRGVLYIVMEFMDDGTLRERLYPGRPLPLDQVVSVTGQICDALQYAHRAGIYHRDIKPENMFFSSDGTVKLGDFGIARLAQSITETVSGVLLGTPAYMSYEQAKGHEIDGRSDLYALGVVLYEMVTGRCPFTADNPLALVEKHIRESPVPPSRINPIVSTQIEGVIMRALEKDRNRRFQTAEEMARALGYDKPMHTSEYAQSPAAIDSALSHPIDSPIPNRLLLVSSDGCIIPLKTEKTSLTRSHINPDDLEMSREHARVIYRGGHYWIEDLGSSNGTFVNGLRIFSSQVLRPGDEIRLGRTVLRVE